MPGNLVDQQCAYTTGWLPDLRQEPLRHEDVVLPPQQSKRLGLTKDSRKVDAFAKVRLGLDDQGTSAFAELAVEGMTWTPLYGLFATPDTRISICFLYLPRSNPPSMLFLPALQLLIGRFEQSRSSYLVGN